MQGLRLPARAGRAAACVLLAVQGVVSAQEPLPGDLRTCLDQARQANAQLDLEKQRRVLEHGESLEGDPEDAAEAQRMLAVLDWKYHLRYETARERLLRAVTGAESAEAWIALARLEQAREDFPVAREAAEQAVDAAGKPRIRRQARVLRARIAVAEAVAERRKGNPARNAALHRAFDDMADYVREHPGYLDSSRALLRASLLLDDGATALLAWRSYFHTAPGGPYLNAIEGAGRKLERLLPAWRGSESGPRERAALVAALAESRLFTEAELVARDPRSAGTVLGIEAVQSVLAYSEYLEEVGRLTKDYYRRTSIGENDYRRYRRAFQDATAGLMAELEGRKRRRAYKSSMLADLEARFGAHVSLGRTAGVYNLHMGHAVIDERRTVEQYGRRAEVRFVQLDTIISNGYQSWAWENGGQHGGWGEAEAIWQVRPAYVAEPLAIWRSLQDPAEVREFVERMEEETDRDEARASRNPHAFLPGLAMRLKYRVVMELVDRLRATGLEGEAMREAFLGEMDRVVQEYSIFAHEGRHAIDALGAGKLNKTNNSEFTAKLSQVVFSSEPRLAFVSILSPGMGDSTPHGRAGLLVVKGVVRWMERHRDEIQGLDRKRPMLLQLDLLSDDQIREACRSLDPLSKR